MQSEREFFMQFVTWLRLPAGLVLALLAAMPHAFAGVTVKRQTMTYEVQGSTARELETQMNRLGPSPEGSSKRSWARTDWQITWKFRYKDRGLEGCDMTEVWTDIKLEFIYPFWTRKTGASATLRSTWGAAMRALEKHEQGHAAMAIETAEKIDSDLSGLVSIISCQRLKYDANRIANALLEDLRQKDQAYDLETNHGGETIPVLRD
jgi:predicted secreted Zn-dependent protease